MIFPINKLVVVDGAFGGVNQLHHQRRCYNHELKEAIRHCWEKVGLLAIWDVILSMNELFRRRNPLLKFYVSFPTTINDDNSVAAFEEDDSAPENLRKSI